MIFLIKTPKRTLLCQTLLVAMMPTFASSPTLNPMDIEAKLAKRDVSTNINSHNKPTESPTISRLDGNISPVGLNVQMITKLPTLESVVQQDQSDELNPNDYIPVYEYEELTDEVSTPTEVSDEPLAEPNAVKRLYNRLFKDGVETVPRIKVAFYQGNPQGEKTTDLHNKTKFDNKALKSEPFANIKATLEEMTAQSMSDFTGAMPRLHQAVVNASRAVGYYELDFSLVKTGADELALIVHDMGKPVKVTHQIIDIQGKGATHPTYTAITQDTKLNVGDTFHHGHYETLKTRLAEASGEHGFFDSKWLSSSAEVILPDNSADVSMVYDTGEQYTFDDVVFFTVDPDTGELTTDPDKLPVRPKILKQLITFNMGDEYNRTATRNLSNSLLATGFFNAINTEIVLPDATQSNVSTAPPPDNNPNQDKETVVLDDGVVVDVSPIEFSTSQAIQDKLNLIKQKANQLYLAPDDRLLITDSRKQSKSILGRISDAVSNMARVILPDESGDEPLKISDEHEPPVLHGKKTAQQVYTDKKVPLYVFVMSDKPKDAQLGIGWGSDSGTRLTGKFEHRLLNRHGMQAGLDTKWSKNAHGVQAYLTRPYKHPLNDTLKASLSYEAEVLNEGTDFELGTRTLETTLSRNRVSETGWNRNYALSYRLDELDTKAPQHLWEELPLSFNSRKSTQEALLLGYSMHKITADNVANPMRGYRQFYSFRTGMEGLATDTTLGILEAKLSGVYSFGDNAYGKNRQHQLIGSLHGGYLWAKEFDKVPYKLRFFAGGDQSIRGYNYQSLSPTSEQGYPTGGQALAVASGEYNYEIMEGLRLGVFADVGNAYDKDLKNDTKIGAGVGVRYASPVGQIRLDVATGVGEEGNPIKLHFFIGVPF